ncbi:MAG: LysR family transcriptional regulator [Mariprofundaceae bacterium]
MITLEQLRTLQNIVKFGGFRAASEAMHKSQSAVSTSIRNLESQLSTTLFTRDQYRPKLTPQGQAILQRAQDILAQSDELVRTAQQFKAGIEPILAIAMSAIVPIQPILKLFHELNQHYPSTQLSLMMETLNGSMERLSDHDADIAITEVSQQHSDYDYIHISQVEMVSIIGNQSKWAKQLKQYNSHNIKTVTQIIVPDSSLHSPKRSVGVIDHAQQWFVSDMASKKEIILSGMGWGRMPRHMIETELESNQLLQLPQAEFPVISISIKAVRRRHETLGIVGQQIWQQLQQLQN